MVGINFQALFIFQHELKVSEMGIRACWINIYYLYKFDGPTNARANTNEWCEKKIIKNYGKIKYKIHKHYDYVYEMWSYEASIGNSEHSENQTTSSSLTALWIFHLFSKISSDSFEKIIEQLCKSLQ